jgi:thiamine biosynthesis protein ThiC
MIVGRNFSKNKCNIGNSAVTSTIEEEVEKRFGLAVGELILWIYHGKTFTKLENGSSVILQPIGTVLSTKL